MITLFDTHAHIGEGEDAFLIMKEAEEAGVTRIILCGSDLSTSLDYANLAEKREGLYFSAGIHPHSACSAANNGIPELKRLYKHPKCVAVGECGLDYFYEFSKREEQILIFKKAIDDAYNYGLPLIVHCRDKERSENAYADCAKILEDFSRSGGNFVMHCFTGPKNWLAQFLELGAYISFGGIITFQKAENVRELLKLTPHDRILFETDSPYLAPVPYRGKNNHPKYLPLIVEKASEILSISYNVLAEIALNNSFHLFKKVHRNEKNN